jgi:hypothetical protein
MAKQQTAFSRLKSENTEQDAETIEALETLSMSENALNTALQEISTLKEQITAPTTKKRPTKSRVAPHAMQALGQILSKIPATERHDKVRHNAFLHSKGINPNSPVQLDLLFPAMQGNDQRFIPNDYARSSLFTARNKTVPRRAIQQEQLFHLHENIRVIYTGIELRAEDDELVWLQTLHYAKAVPLGDPIHFRVRQLCKDLGWPLNGVYYDKVRNSLSRMHATSVMVHNQKAFGNGGAVNLIGDFIFTDGKDGKPTAYKICIQKDLLLLFAGNTFTNHNWNAYRNLGPVARRLADYIESNRHPYPLKLEKFMKMCGCEDTQMKSWRDTVKQACAAVEKSQIAHVWYANGSIHCLRED